MFVVYRLKFEDDSPPDQAPSATPVQEYYCDDPQFPIYSRIMSGYVVGPLLNLLMVSEGNHSQICSVRPRGVFENATFVIDLDEVCFSDLRSDELGSWKATGTKSTWFRLTNDGVRIFVKKPPGSKLCNLYLYLLLY